MKNNEILKLINETLDELSNVDSIEIGGKRQFHLHKAIGKLNCVVNGADTSQDQALNLAGVMPRFSKEDVVMLLEKRRKDAFDNDFHKYENTKLQRAIDAILQLMPPEYFPNGA